MRKISFIGIILSMLFLASHALAQTKLITTKPCSSCQGLPKTGQQSCYDASGNVISCSGSGQDAEYADPAGSYDISYPRGKGSWENWVHRGRFTAVSGAPPSSGTVLDNATGLEWIANMADTTLQEFYNWTNAINACLNLTYATQTDWRLPNLKELLSIVDYSAYNPAVNTLFFTASSYMYWSSTNAHDSGWSACEVDFTSSSIDCTYPKTISAGVRCVRGGQ